MSGLAGERRREGQGVELETDDHQPSLLIHSPSTNHSSTDDMGDTAEEIDFSSIPINERLVHKVRGRRGEGKGQNPPIHHHYILLSLGRPANMRTTVLKNTSKWLKRGMMRNTGNTLQTP